MKNVSMLDSKKENYWKWLYNGLKQTLNEIIEVKFHYFVLCFIMPFTICSLLYTVTHHNILFPLGIILSIVIGLLSFSYLYGYKDLRLGDGK